MRTPRIYFAAPFFSQGEKESNERTLSMLEKSFLIFYPYRDGLRMQELVARGVAPSDAANQVWICDFEQIRACDVLVAVLDGRVPDEGVCIELGLARGLGKRTIGLMTDSRTCFSWGANPMVMGCLSCVVFGLSSLVEAIRSSPGPD